MGTYKASRNNSEEVIEEEKSEKEQKKESTAKALDVGLETGLDVYTAGAFSKAKKAVTSVPIAGKMLQKKWDKSIDKAAGILSKTPVGNLAKKADDAGITDAARGVKDTYNMANGQMPNNDSKSNGSSGKSNIFSNLSRLKSKTGSKGNFFGNGLKTGNFLSFKMKLIIIGCFVGFFLFVCIFMTVFAEPDDVNMGLTNNTEMSAKNKTITKDEVLSKLVYLNDTDLETTEINGNSIYVLSITNLDNIDEVINSIKNIMGTNNYYIKSTGNGDVDTKLKNEFEDKILENQDDVSDEVYRKELIKYGNINSGDLAAALQLLANWYIENVHTYQVTQCGAGRGTGTRKYYDNPFISRKIGDDCTEFTGAYMSYVCGAELRESYSGEMVDTTGSWAKEAEACGWKAYSTDDIGELQYGDVLIADGSVSYSRGGHGEVYINSNQSFGWGSCHSVFPTDNAISKTTNGGHTVFKDGSHIYITVYRYMNPTNGSAGSETNLGG